MKALGLGTALVVAVAVSALLDDETGWRIWHELRADLEDARVRIEELAQENAALRREIHTLESEPEALGRVIREELDLALPGEVVVRFREASEAAASPRSGERESQ